MNTPPPTPAQPLHTPIPWRADGKTIYGPPAYPVPVIIATFSMTHVTGEDAGNAAITAKAVNAHAANEAKIAALVKALEELAVDLEEISETCDDSVTGAIEDKRDDVWLTALSNQSKRKAAKARAALSLART